MITPSQIIKDLGGAAFVAAELSIPYTTVHNWVRKQTLPNWRCSDLLTLAKRLQKPASVAAIKNHSAASVSRKRMAIGTPPYNSASVPNGDA